MNLAPNYGQRTREQLLTLAQSSLMDNGQQQNIEVSDIQGGSLLGFNKPHQHFIFLRVNHIGKARNWLQKLIPYITTTEDVLNYREHRKLTNDLNGSSPPSVVWIHISFSHQGLTKFLNQKPSNFCRAYQGGIASRNFLDGKRIFGSGISSMDSNSDFLLWIAADSFEAADASTQVLIESAGRKGIQTLALREGNQLPGSTEHFGYRDGISQPDFGGSAPNGEKEPTAVKEARSSTDFPAFEGGSEIGDFIVTDTDPVNRKRSPIPPWSINGSFLVYINFLQNVSMFREVTIQTARQIRRHDPDLDFVTPEYVGSRMFGRWNSGAPVIKSPTKDSVSMKLDNDFSFWGNRATYSDPDGLRCPFSGHIRKSYPRDEAFADKFKRTPFAPRILRRGIPYGKPYPAKNDRGLLFLCFQSSIEDQFEHIFDKWILNSDFPKANVGVEPIVGAFFSEDRVFRFIIEGNNGKRVPVGINIPKNMVRPLEGGYYFSPSISVLYEIVG